MNDDDRPSRGNVRVKRSADAPPVCRLSLSLSLSFALSRADDDDGKKISTTQRKEIYIKISFEFKKITPRPRRKGVSRANYIAPRHHHHHHHHHSRLFKVARAAHTQKKTYLHRRRRNLRASERRRSLRGRRRRRANRRERLDGERGGQHFIYVILLCVLVFG